VACASHGFDLDEDSFGARNCVSPTGGNHQITVLITGSVCLFRKLSQSKQWVKGV